MTDAVFGEIRNRSGERLDYACHGAAGGEGRVVVIGHGLTSAKDRPWSLALGAALAGAGFTAIRFSFAGNGGSEGAFADATPTKEVGDLLAVVDAVGGRWLAYVGHSMGAAVGVLAAAGEPRIRALVSLAGMVRVAGFMRRHFAGRRPGDLILDKPGFPLAQALLDDARRIDSVVPQARGLDLPWLLVHGTADELVPVGDAEEAVAAAPRAELRRLAGADHRFDGREAEVAKIVTSWLSGLP